MFCVLNLCEGGPKAGNAGPMRSGGSFMQRGTGPYGGMPLLLCKIQLIKLLFTSTKEVYVFAFVYLSVSKITKNDADEF